MMSRKQKIRLAVIAVFVCVLTASAVLLGKSLWEYYRADKANRDLAAEVHAMAEDDVPTESEEGSGSGETDQPPKPTDFRYAPVIEQNSDAVAWLTAEGIGVDLPVVYTPDDYDQYLRLGFDKKYAVSGTLFIGENCKPDEGNIIIYGHRMNNKTMFGALVEYESEEFAREYPILTYDLIHEDGSFERLYFEVFTAFYSQIAPDSDTSAFRYYNYTDLSDIDVFHDYINKVFEHGLYDLGVRPEYGDRLLTLSTCSYHVKQGRFVVVAREVKNPDLD